MNPGLACFRYLLPTLLLSMLALAGNVLRVPVFFGVDFLFGSIFVLLAVSAIGTLCGLMTATVAGLYTMVIWGHPYALAIFILEAGVVGLLLNRGLKNLVLADILFWVVLGVPLVWLFYSEILNMETSSALLIMLKQPVNGIANAIIASFVLLLIPQRVYRWLSMSGRTVRIGVRDLVFALLLSAAFFPILAASVYGQREQQAELEHKLLSELSDFATTLKRFIEQSRDEHEISSALEVFAPPDRSGAREILLLDNSGGVWASSLDKTLAESMLKTGGNETVLSALMRWLPPRQDQPVMTWWAQTYYYVERPVSSPVLGRIRVALRANHVIDRLNQNLISSMALLVFVVLAGSGIAFLVSRMLTRPMETLSQLTRDIPERLQFQEDIHWPRSRVRELEELSGNAQQTAASLKASFNELLRARQELEQRVEERTQSLNEAVTLLGSIIDSSLDGIITIDADGTIVGFNQAAAYMFAYDADELLGRNINMLMPQPFRDRHTGYLRSYQKTRKARVIGSRREVEAQRKDGSLFPAELSVSESGSGGQVRYTGTLVDISQRKEADRLKAEFISNVSHELRTPLTAIRGAIGLLASNSIERGGESGQELLTISLSNTDRLVRLINDLLDVQKIESGEHRVTLRPLPLMPLIEESIKVNQPYADQFDVSIQLERSDEDNIIVLTHPDRMVQVMTNLLSNAAKYSPQGDVVKVAVSVQEGRVRIVVRDEGPGIPENMHAQIFEKFVQADALSARSRGGTGLGLSIARALVEHMMGNIYLDPGVKRGASFVVELPLAGAGGGPGRVAGEPPWAAPARHNRRASGHPLPAGRNTALQSVGRLCGVAGTGQGATAPSLPHTRR